MRVRFLPLWEKVARTQSATDEGFYPRTRKAVAGWRETPHPALRATFSHKGETASAKSEVISITLARSCPRSVQNRVWALQNQRKINFQPQASQHRLTWRVAGLAGGAVVPRHGGGRHCQARTQTTHHEVTAANQVRMNPARVAVPAHWRLRRPQWTTMTNRAAS
jgi:hypothetical protein